MNYVESFDILGLKAKQIPCIKLNGAPTTSTEGAVGLLGMDISSESYDLYKCVAVNENGYIWKLVGGSGSGDMLKSTYDADDDGVVDNAKLFDGMSREELWLFIMQGTLQTHEYDTYEAFVDASSMLSAGLGEHGKTGEIVVINEDDFPNLIIVNDSIESPEISQLPDRMPKEEALNMIYSKGYLITKGHLLFEPIGKYNLLANKENSSVEIIDNLESDNSYAALSANQGRVLNDKLSSAYKYCGKVSDIHRLPKLSFGSDIGNVYKIENGQKADDNNFEYEGNGWSGIISDGNIYSDLKPRLYVYSNGKYTSELLQKGSWFTLVRESEEIYIYLEEFEEDHDCWIVSISSTLDNKDYNTEEPLYFTKYTLKDFSCNSGDHVAWTGYYWDVLGGGGDNDNSFVLTGDVSVDESGNPYLVNMNATFEETGNELLKGKNIYIKALFNNSIFVIPLTFAHTDLMYFDAVIDRYNKVSCSFYSNNEFKINMQSIGDFSTDEVNIKNGSPDVCPSASAVRYYVEEKIENLNIPHATYETPGILTVGDGFILETGKINIREATDIELQHKCISDSVLTPNYLDYAVKYSTHQDMSDNYDVNSLTVSETFKLEDKGTLPVSYNAIKSYADKLQLGSVDKDYLIEQVNNINSIDFSLYDAEYQNGYIGGDGTLKKLASYRATNLVYVKKGLKIKYKLKHATVSPIIGLYSGNSMELKNFIDRVDGFNGVSEGEYIVPSDGYICFVTLEGYKEGYVIFDNSIFDGIKDYVKGYVNNKVEDANNLNLNILCLGDSIFGNDGEIVSYLAQFTGSNVINGAIGGTRASIRVSNTDAFQFLDGQNLVRALTSGDWTNQDSAVSTLTTYSSWLPSRVETLKSVDLSKIDLVTMDWGTNDYAGGQTIETILSAYDAIIDSLQSAYPELRILITTPIWRYFNDTENGDNKVYADATLRQIAEAIEEFAKEKRVHVLNAYQNMPLNYNTATTYFDTDSGVHLNKKGNEVYAHLLNGKIRTLF